jgi:beta-glucosidase/6-phospho-beta-glucosidase/beta-galactosidase
MSNRKFPDNFVWDAASEAYQIEGAWYKDGKGLSIWDVFCRLPSAIRNGESGEVTYDHYHHNKELRYVLLFGYGCGTAGIWLIVTQINST